MKMYMPTTRITLISALNIEVRTALDASPPNAARRTATALSTRGAKLVRATRTVRLIA